MTDGDLADSGESIEFWLWDVVGRALAMSCVKSRRAGFFFRLGGDIVPSMSRMVLAFEGRPFAIADDEVCCDIDRGTRDLS